MNNLINLANSISSLVLDTEDKGISIGLQQARCIVLGAAMDAATDEDVYKELASITAQSIKDALDLEAEYFAEQKQPAESTKEVELDSDTNVMTLQEAIEIFERNIEEE